MPPAGGQRGTATNQQLRDGELEKRVFCFQLRRLVCVALTQLTSDDKQATSGGASLTANTACACVAKHHPRERGKAGATTASKDLTHHNSLRLVAVVVRSIQHLSTARSAEEWCAKGRAATHHGGECGDKRLVAPCPITAPTACNNNAFHLCALPGRLVARATSTGRPTSRRGRRAKINKNKNKKARPASAHLEHRRSAPPQRKPVPLDTVIQHTSRHNPDPPERHHNPLVARRACHQHACPHRFPAKLRSVGVIERQPTMHPNEAT